MSGGSYDYAQFKLDEWAETLRRKHPDEMHVLALADHFVKLGEVMGKIEWADSGDTSWDELIDAAIRDVLLPGAELTLATERARLAHHSLGRLLKSAVRGSTPSERETPEQDNG